MEVKFRTLTPVFTGDRYTNQSPQLRETGIIGSLRFWAGAVARGLGLEVKSPKDVKAESMHDVENLDPVNLVFGCTGWKRPFNLEIKNTVASLPMSGNLRILTTNRGWYLKPGFLLPWQNEVQVRFLFRNPVKDKYLKEATGWIALTWCIMHRLSGIGAHQGWGYGQIRLCNPLTYLNMIKIKIEQSTKSSNSGLPDLADFIFGEYEFDKEITLNPLKQGANDYSESKQNWNLSESPALLKPVGLSLRYALHFGLGSYTSRIGSWNKAFFGGSGENPKTKKKDPAGRFHASFIYRVDKNGNPDPEGDRLRFRVWAWLPKNVFRDKETDGKPDWCTAADMLRKELCCKDLWKAVANCAPPKECYFWPIARADTKVELKPLSPILKIIEDRASKVLGRKCV